MINLFSFFILLTKSIGIKPASKAWENCLADSSRAPPNRSPWRICQRDVNDITRCCYTQHMLISLALNALLQLMMNYQGSTRDVGLSSSTGDVRLSRSYWSCLIIKVLLEMLDYQGPTGDVGLSRSYWRCWIIKSYWRRRNIKVLLEMSDYQGPTGDVGLSRHYNGVYVALLPQSVGLRQERIRGPSRHGRPRWCCGHRTQLVHGPLSP